MPPIRSRPTPFDAPVLIVGGGPVGLGLAFELGSRGVATVVVERRLPSEPFPGLVNLANMRTMEFFRRWGLADHVADHDPVPSDIDRSLAFVTRLNGHVLLALDGAFAFNEAPPFAAAAPAWSPLPAFDRALRHGLATLDNVEVRWGTSVIGAEQDADGVTLATSTRDGVEDTLRGSYLAIADGGKSDVARQLGFAHVDGPEIPESTAWHFRAPGLAERARVPPMSATFFVNDAHQSDALIAQGPDEWLYVASPVPAGVDGDDWTAVEALIHESVGSAFPADPIEGGRRGTRFRLGSEMQRGRSFLVGDAAHFVPLPGWGMNLGLADAVDLGWKLAAVADGWGGPGLLASYDAERQQAKRFVLEALAGLEIAPASSFLLPHLDDEGAAGDAARAEAAEMILRDRMAEFATTGAELGYHYDRSTTVVPDGSAPEPQVLATYTPSGRPGNRAPHAWLEDDVSLYDLLGPGMTLLRAGDADLSSLATAAAERGLPLKAVDLPDVPGLREAYGADLVLVRPDQHVAWRGDVLPDDLDELLTTVSGGDAASSRR